MGCYAISSASHNIFGLTCAHVLVINLGLGTVRLELLKLYSCAVSLLRSSMFLAFSHEGLDCLAYVSWISDLLCFCLVDDAFLCQPAYFNALCICLEAIEQNSPRLLTEIDYNLVSSQAKLQYSVFIIINVADD